MSNLVYYLFQISWYILVHTWTYDNSFFINDKDRINQFGWYEIFCHKFKHVDGKSIADLYYSKNGVIIWFLITYLGTKLIHH